MYFSPKTIVVVAGLLASTNAAPAPSPLHEASQSGLMERSDMSERGFFDSWFTQQTQQTPLCNKPNYGAVGKPWEHNSTPGAFCGSKPRNDGQWKNIVNWDGGDKVKCNSWWSSWGMNVCSGGNKKSPLPWGCKPPKKGGNTPKPSASSAAPSKAASSAPASSAPASSAPASSAPASSAPASSAPAASSAAPSDAAVSSAASSAAAPLPSDTNTTPVDTDPYSNPVCTGNYQQTYKNYTLVAPNGYWYGKTVGAATQDASYMTFTLTTDPASCLTACDNIEGCVFVNTYIDRNDDEAYLLKHTPGVYTCAMFSKCVGTEKNDNWGGQDDPNDIVDSTGWCKSGACGGRS